MINETLKNIIDSLSSSDKDSVYRYLWFNYVKDDVKSHAESIDAKLTTDDIEFIADRYVYDGDYDCNLNYWTNIENLINEVVKEKESREEELISKISSFAKRKEEKEKAEKLEKKKEYENLCETIKGFASDIENLINLAILAKSQGIQLAHKYGYGHKDDSYEKGVFITNSISHIFGFYESGNENNRNIRGIGIKNGGYCGNINLLVNKNGLVIFINNCTEHAITDIDEPTPQMISDLKTFIESFPKFKKSFLDYIEEKVTF